MSRVCVLFAWVALSVGVQGTATAAPIYNAATDFSLAGNPNGPWSYGTTGTTLTGPFTVVTNAVTYLPAMLAWQTLPGSQFDYPPGKHPSVFHNADAATYTNLTQSLPPGALALHPGEGGQYAVLRFTAPTSGAYDYTAAFSSGDNYGATTDVHVLLNGALLHSGTVPAGASFTGTLNLSAGDRIDFAVGRGSNNTWFYDTTLANVVITQVPEPASLTLFGLATLIGVCYGRRWRAR